VRPSKLPETSKKRDHEEREREDTGDQERYE
jgi:hypothetical protein